MLKVVTDACIIENFTELLSDKLSADVNSHYITFPTGDGNIYAILWLPIVHKDLLISILTQPSVYAGPKKICAA